MGKGHRTCEVCGVKERHSGEKSFLFSKFPLDPNRCREWLKAVGNEELVHNMPIEKLHDQRNVCQNHFRRNDFNKKGNRLKRDAVPTLNLMAVPLTDTQLAEFPLHVWRDTNEPAPSTSENKAPGPDQKTIPDMQIETDPMPVPVPSTSQQKRNILVELSLNEPAPSTSENKAPGPDQKTIPDMQIETDPMPVPVPSTSQQKRNILVELSLNAQIPTKSPKRSGETLLNKEKRRRTSQSHEKPIFVQEEVASTIQQDSQIAVESSQNELSPRKKKLLKELQKTKLSLSSLRKSANLIDKIESTVLKEIVTSAIKNQKRKPKGRRWTTKNKISALAIFKRSPKTYRYLQHIMPLPTVKTLHNVLKKIPMEPGINHAVLQHLKKISGKKNDQDKYCGLVFDEIALKRRLLFNQTTDKIEGYEDLGSAESGRSLQLADHALVFMLQGVRAKFKQPIAFYFVKGTVSSQKLASLIKEIIRAVEETGFKILTTICDQGPTNMGALKILKTLCPPPHDHSRNYFKCGDKKIYIIYDVPHLFKSIRNNFNIYGEITMNGMKAKWAHLLKVEEKNRQILYLSKVTPVHVQPKFRAKMKVKYAAQILSNTVSAVLKLLAEAEKDPVKSEEIMQTGIIVHDLDRLFDLTNGPSGPDDEKPGLRENVSTKTDHINAWAEYRAKLETVKFKNPNTGISAKNVRCIEGYQTTLRSLRDIWSELSGLGFQYLNLRQLNQDALENLFGVIRQHSPTNRNPTCCSFIAALKTSIISGMTAPHNRGSNCEKDFKKLLTDFHDLVFDDPEKIEELPNKQKNNVTEVSEQGEYVAAVNPKQEFPLFSIPEVFEEIESDLADMEQQPLVYVSGYIASSILKTQKCLTCAKCLKIEDPEDDPVFSYIKLREWWADKRSLTYPTKDLCRLVEAAMKIFEREILPCLHYLNVCQLTVTLFMTKCDSSFIACKEHGVEVVNGIYIRLALLLIRRQCEKVNQKLSLHEETSADSNKKAQQQGIAK